MGKRQVPVPKVSVFLRRRPVTTGLHPGDKPVGGYDGGTNMLYIGHFSIDEISENSKRRHGYFTCMVDTDNVDQAVELFKALIEKMKAENSNFADIAAVYIEDIFEIRQVPKTATILRMQSSVGEFPKSVSRSLPFGETKEITAYGWAPDVRKIREAEKDEVLEMEPFLRFT
jgi:hypothetical protein